MDKKHRNTFSLWLFPLHQLFVQCVLFFHRHPIHKQFLSITFVPFVCQINPWNCIVYLEKSHFSKPNNNKKRIHWKNRFHFFAIGYGFLATQTYALFRNAVNHKPSQPFPSPVKMHFGRFHFSISHESNKIPLK